MPSPSARDSMAPMKTIRLDASGWRCTEDMWGALLPALRAPDWHGHNLNALWDSLVGGDINATEPPFRVVVAGAAGMPAEVADCLARVAVLFEEARRDEGVEVWMEVG